MITDGGELVSAAIEKICAQAHSRLDEMADDGLAMQAPVSVYGDATKLMRKVGGQTVALRSKLQHVLRSLSYESEVVGTTGVLDVRRLYRLRFGDLRVFKRTEEGLGRTVHVELLTDFSSSMQDHGRAKAAKEWCASMGIALEGLRGVRCGWSAFMGTDTSRICVLKVPSDSTQSACSRLVALEPQGSTPLASALRQLRPRLLKEPVDRRILMVGTDGEPNSLSAAKREIRLMREAGVEVIVFGIQQDASALDADAISITDLSLLSPVLFARLEEMLTAVMAEAA